MKTQTATGSFHPHGQYLRKIAKEITQLYGWVISLVELAGTAPASASLAR